MKLSNKKLVCIIIALTLIALLAIYIIISKTTKTPGTDSDGSGVTMDDIMEMQGNSTDYDNGIYFEEELDSAEIVSVKKSSDDFIGSWKATSGQAAYQYGNVDLVIKANGEWSGNVSDEELSGEWTETDEGLHLTSTLFDCDLVFTDSGSLVMRYTPNEDEEYLNTVLTKQ